MEFLTTIFGGWQLLPTVGIFWPLSSHFINFRQSLDIFWQSMATFSIFLAVPPPVTHWLPASFLQWHVWRWWQLWKWWQQGQWRQWWQQGQEGELNWIDNADNEDKEDNEDNEHQWMTVRTVRTVRSMKTMKTMIKMMINMTMSPMSINEWGPFSNFWPTLATSGKF